MVESVHTHRHRGDRFWALGNRLGIARRSKDSPVVARYSPEEVVETPGLEGMLGNRVASVGSRRSLWTELEHLSLHVSHP